VRLKVIGCTRLAAASDKVYQLLAHGRWFSPGTPASSTTKTGRLDTAEILLKVALKQQKSKSNQMNFNNEVCHSGTKEVMTNGWELVINKQQQQQKGPIKPTKTKQKIYIHIYVLYICNCCHLLLRILDLSWQKTTDRAVDTQ
jgi:hypothetical protein